MHFIVYQSGCPPLATPAQIFWQRRKRRSGGSDTDRRSVLPMDNIMSVREPPYKGTCTNITRAACGGDYVNTTPNIRTSSSIERVQCGQIGNGIIPTEAVPKLYSYGYMVFMCFALVDFQLNA